MPHPYQILLPLLSLFLVRVDLTDLYPLKLEVKVWEVVDGDTLIVKKGTQKLKVRLARIDSPEKGQPFIKGGDAGHASTNCLKKTLKQKEFSSLLIEKLDIYGRWLGDLEGLTFELVKNGCSGLYPHASFSSVLEKNEYLRVLQKAKREGRGIWAQGGFRRPQLWRKTSKRSARRR